MGLRETMFRSFAMELPLQVHYHICLSSRFGFEVQHHPIPISSPAANIRQGALQGSNLPHQPFPNAAE
jgi:hypothetical protein